MHTKAIVKHHDFESQEANALSPTTGTVSDRRQSSNIHDLNLVQIPMLIDEDGNIYQEEVSDNIDTRQTADIEIYNDVPNMPDHWYWRYKPLSKNSVKVGQKYWVD